MDLLSHIFLPLILLVAIGRLKANYLTLKASPFRAGMRREKNIYRICII
ncbi:MAG: hypothetical protein V6S10_00380 [Candidatus Methanoglobus sp.]